jgi:beta-lactam-binding protein with PASTA domain
MEGSRRARHGGVLLAALLLWGTAASAQDVEDVSLTSGDAELAVLTPDAPVAEVSFEVDEASLLVFDVITEPGVFVTGTGPGGEVLDDTTLPALGGALHVYEIADGDTVGLPSVTVPGFHVTLVVPSLGPGSYSLRFVSPLPLAQPVAVIATLLSDSPVGAQLLLADDPLQLGLDQILVAVVYADDEPVLGAVAEVEARHDGQPTVPVALLDDGVEPDDAAGDGLYSGSFTPSLAGDYTLSGAVSGVTPGGTPFTRDLDSAFRVVSPGAALAAGPRASREDDDANGFYERLIVELDVQVATPGSYELYVELEAPLETLAGDLEIDLPAGPATLAVEFTAAELRAVGADGPLRFARLDLDRSDGDDLEPAFALEDLGFTASYPLGEWERERVQRTGNVFDLASDTDSNGLFDQLVVQIELDLLEGGEYEWSGELVDGDGHAIELATGAASFAAGIQTAVLVFDGARIGAAGRDGPYRVAGFLIGDLSGRNALIADPAGETGPYRFDEFESAPPVVAVPDVGGLSRAAAEATLAAAGLTLFEIDRVADPAALETTLAQNPAAGTEVGAGYGVSLTVSNGPLPERVPHVVGTDTATAQAILADAGLLLGDVTEVADLAPRGRIVSQSPSSDALASPGLRVDVTVATGPVALPDFTGQYAPTAELALQDLGIGVAGRIDVPNPAIPVGRIVASSPVPGSELFPGSRVLLYVSEGLPTVTVPDVVGLQDAAAQAAVEAAGLFVGTIVSVSDPAPAGVVLEQIPAAGLEVPRGGAVTLTISLGAAGVVVPDLLGVLEATAAEALRDAGLEVGVVTRRTAPSPAGLVLEQLPLAGETLPAGSPVDLVVSDGPPAPRVVPDVVGLPEADAAAALTAAGLVVGAVARTPDPAPVDSVVAQNPSAGSAAPAGSAVDLIVSDGPGGLVAVPDLVGETQASASFLLLGVGLSVGSVQRVVRADLPAGEVFAQSPSAGALVAPGAPVDLSVSAGPADFVSFTIQKSGPASAFEAEEIEYVLRFENTGTLPAQNVVVTDTLASDVFFEWASDGGVYDLLQRRVTWSIGELLPNEPREVTLLASTRCGDSQVLNSTYTVSGSGVQVSGSTPVVTALQNEPVGSYDVDIESFPQAPLPLEAGDEILHVVRITNPLPVYRPTVRLPLRSGDGSVFGDVIETGAGRIREQNPFNWTWIGSLPPDATTEIVFTTIVEDCLRGSLERVGLDHPGSIFQGCTGSTSLSDLEVDRFPVQLPIEASVQLLDSAPPVRNPLFGGETQLQIAGAGAPVQIEVSLANPTNAPVGPVSATVGLPGDLLAASLVAGSDPAFTLVAGGLDFSGSFAAGETRSARISAQLDGAGSCQVSLDLVGDVDGCSDAIRETLSILQVSAPPGAFLAGVDPFSAVWSYEPGVSALPEPLLCLTGEIYNGIATGSNGDVWVAGLPSFRLNPQALEFQFYLEEGLQGLINPDDVVIDETRTPATAIFSATDPQTGEALLLRLDPESGARELILREPGLGRLGRLELDAAGRILALSDTLGLLRIDASGPLPLPPNAYEQLPVPANVDFAASLGELLSQGPGLLAREPGGGLLVGVFSQLLEDFGDPAALPFQITSILSLQQLDDADQVTELAPQLTAQVIRQPGGTQPLPAFLDPLLADPVAALTVAPDGTLYLGDASPGSLARIDRNGALDAETLVPPSFAVLGAVDLAWFEPGSGGAGDEPADLDAQLMDAPDPADVGELIEWELQLVNLGPGEAAGVEVLVELPTQVALVSWPVACSLEDGSLRCAGGTLTSGGARDWRLQGIALEAGEALVTAAAGSSVPDPVPGNDSASALTGIRGPLPVAVDPGADRTVIEGDELILMAGFEDLQPGPHLALIDWGDGSPLESVGVDPSAAGGTLEARHVYAEDGLYTATLSIQGAVSPTGTGALEVTVLNAPPVPDLGGDAVLQIAQPFVLPPAAFTDPGVEDTHGAIVDWGDGGVEVPTLVQRAGSGTIAASHDYATPGVYLVELCVTDDEQATGCDTANATVGGARAPLLDAGPDRMILEGQAVALPPSLFSDPDLFETHTASVDWGDGSPIAPAEVLESRGEGSIAAQHTLLDDGVYAVLVTLADSSGEIASGGFAVQVANVAPSVDAGPDGAGAAGEAVGLIGAAFSDPGTLDTHSATVSWGDGSPAEPAGLQQGAGGGSIAAQHVYALGGGFVAELCVRDDDGGVGCDSVTFEISGDVEPLPAILDLAARPKDGKIDLTWTPVPGAVSYDVIRRESGEPSFTRIAAGHVTDYAVYADFGLSNGVSYCYVVHPVDALARVGPSSDEVCATPIAGSERRGGGGGATTVPEPGGRALLAAGIVLLGMLRRRRA